MKTMKSLLLVAAIAFSSVLSASTPDNAKSVKAAETSIITTAVEQLLQNPSFLVDEDMTAKVTLTINKDNEIVVLSVESENERLEGFLKNRLNYNALPVAVAKGQKTFVIPVRITAEI